MINPFKKIWIKEEKPQKLPSPGGEMPNLYPLHLEERMKVRGKLDLDTPTHTLPRQRLCRKSVHGSTSSPRTDHGTLKINYLAVRPFDKLRTGSERVEGRTANCDTAH